MGIKICSLRSGSQGNCILISDENTKILIDCGLSGKLATLCLEKVGVNPSDISAILVTHEHSDHIKGVGILSRKYAIPIYASEGTWRNMGACGNISDENKYIINAGEVFSFGDILATSFPLSHDAAEPLGFSFLEGGKKISVATDTGEVNEELFSAICGSSVVLLEANHDLRLLEISSYAPSLKRRIRGDYGHLSNDYAGEVAVRLIKSGTEKIILGHLSNENNYPDLAFVSVKNIIEENNLSLNKDVKLFVAMRDEVSDIFEA